MGTATAQGELWGARARAWADLQEVMFRPLYDAAFTAAGVGRDSRLLDAGCGAGLALSMARTRGATVSGLDAAAGLLDIARTRVPGAELRVGELEALPYDDASFDVVSGFNSFQYAADRVHALAEARRVAKPQGCVIVAVWGRPGQCELGGYLAALGKLLPPPPPGAAGPWSLSPAGALEALVEQAGLRSVHAQSVDTSVTFADEATAHEGLLAAGPAVRAIRATTEATVSAAVTDAIAPYRQSDGSYTLRNEFRFIVARPA